MNHDFEISPGLPLGDWLYEEIADAFVLEAHGRAPERCGT
jgi:hypothetical protein